MNTVCYVDLTHGFITIIKKPYMNSILSNSNSKKYILILSVFSMPTCFKYLLLEILLLWLSSPLLALGRFFFFQFFDPIHSRWDSLYGVSARRKASTYTQSNTNTELTHTIQTSMTWVGFEPMIPAFERAKIVHALDRGATVIGTWNFPTKNFVWIQYHGFHAYYIHKLSLQISYVQITSGRNLDTNQLRVLL
jgi:hypothetical protein